ncbi:MAG: pentapeptide repeat-containing protein [Cyanobacteria bacterium P01_F01_bin.116]
MPLSWKRKPKSETSRKEKRRHYTEQIAYKLYQNRCLRNQSEDANSDWEMAEIIAKSPLRKVLFTCHQPFIKLENLIWEPILTWADNQALLSLLGVIGNVGLIIAVGMYIGSEKQRRDAEKFAAWQTITNAQGQPGSGGRKEALEFLNASSPSKDYKLWKSLSASFRDEKYKEYPGANWRRRAICLWLCTWAGASLEGIDLTATGETVYLKDVQLPDAQLGKANLAGADLRDANLQDAQLWDAKLQNAFLWNANFQGAFFEDANLAGAELTNTNFVNANLEGAKNLKPEQISQAKLCATKLPPDISLDPNRDCEELGIELEIDK